MPERRYWDNKEEKEVALPSDYFECNRCLNDKFAYELNCEIVGKEYKQTCLGCGSVFFADKKYQEEKDRYILVALKKEKSEKTIQEAPKKNEAIQTGAYKNKIPKITPKKRKK